MYCRNCGKEIKDGNEFCTNCGQSINKIKQTTKVQKEKKIKKEEYNNQNIVISKKTLTTVSFIILILIIAILVFLLIKKDNNVKSTVLDNLETNIVSNVTPDNQDTSIKTNEQQQTALQIETNKEYSYEEDGIIAYIKFNADNTFEMSIGEMNTSSFGYLGTYNVNQNIVTITINQEGEMDYYDVQPYTQSITILKDGRLEYKTEYATIIFDKNKELSKSSSGMQIKLNGKIVDVSGEVFNILGSIFSKYQTADDSDIICTNGEECWILDEAGKKVYFDDLTSFENALKQCNKTI